MFCIYSFDFFKKNTDPQLMMFTPSKFLSNFDDQNICAALKNMFHLLLTTTLTTATAHTFLPTASLTKGRTELPLKTYPTINPDDLPVSFDARVAWPKCTSIYEIYDQSNCGDCWAVSSVSAMCFI